MTVNGWRIPAWFVATVTAIVAIVSVTAVVLNDRAAVLQRLENIERALQAIQIRQCAMAQGLAKLNPEISPDLSGVCRGALAP